MHRNVKNTRRIVSRRMPENAGKLAEHRKDRGTMSDCISRKAIIDKVEKQYCAPCKRQGGDLDEDHCCSCVINDVLEKVRRIPAVNVAPVRSWKWVTRNK